MYICFRVILCQIVVSVTLYIIKILSHFDINIKQQNTKPGEIIICKCSKSLQKLPKNASTAGVTIKKMSAVKGLKSNLNLV